MYQPDAARRTPPCLASRGRETPTGRAAAGRARMGAFGRQPSATTPLRHALVCGVSGVATLSSLLYLLASKLR